MWVCMIIFFSIKYRNVLLDKKERGSAHCCTFYSAFDKAASVVPWAASQTSLPNTLIHPCSWCKKVHCSCLGSFVSTRFENTLALKTHKCFKSFVLSKTAGFSVRLVSHIKGERPLTSSSDRKIKTLSDS